jgi:hypothetical protein
MMWLFTTRIGRGIAGAGALLLALLTFGASQRRKGRKQVSDEMTEAYNDTTKEVRNAQTDIPSDPVAVLDSLREFAKRGKGGGDT